MPKSNVTTPARTQLTMNQTTPFLPNLSPVGGKEIIARFDDGRLSSDGGVLLLREVETRLGIADLPGCLPTRRARSRQAQPHPGRYDPHPAVRHRLRLRGLRRPGPAGMAAGRTDETLWPARCCKVSRTGSTVGKAVLELKSASAENRAWQPPA